MAEKLAKESVDPKKLRARGIFLIGGSFLEWEPRTIMARQRVWEREGMHVEYSAGIEKGESEVKKQMCIIIRAQSEEQLRKEVWRDITVLLDLMKNPDSWCIWYTPLEDNDYWIHSALLHRFWEETDTARSTPRKPVPTKKPTTWAIKGGSITGVLKNYGLAKAMIVKKKVT